MNSNKEANDARISLALPRKMKAELTRLARKMNLSSVADAARICLARGLESKINEGDL